MFFIFQNIKFLTIIINTFNIYQKQLQQKFDLKQIIIYYNLFFAYLGLLYIQKIQNQAIIHSYSLLHTMKQIDHLPYNLQGIQTQNRMNFQNDRDIYDIPNTINHLYSKVPQIKNDFKSLGEKREKFKQDLAINKAKLLKKNNFMVQQKRTSSMDINQNTKWVVNNNLTNIPYQQPNFYPAVVPSGPPVRNQIFVNPNQQNQPNAQNLPRQSQQEDKNRQIERLLFQLRSYQQKIQILTRNENRYLKQIEEYKQKLNQIQSILQQKQMTVFNQQTAISDLQKKIANANVVKQKQSPTCQSCQQLTKQISILTKQITELTNQLNTKTQKLRVLQKGGKSSLDNQIKSIKQEFQLKIEQYESRIVIYESKAHQYEKELEMYGGKIQENENQISWYKNTLQQYESKFQQYGRQISYYQSQISHYENQITYLSSQVSKNSEPNQHQNQQTDFREQIFRLRNQIAELKGESEQKINYLTVENQKLSQQIQNLLRQVESARNERQSSQLSNKSQQSSVLSEYERAIQMLQQQINLLRQQLNQKQASGNSNEWKTHYEIQITSLTDKLNEADRNKHHLQNQIGSLERSVNEHKKYSEHLALQTNQYNKKILELQSQISIIGRGSQERSSQNAKLKLQISELKLKLQKQQHPSTTSSDEKLRIEQNVRRIVEQDYRLRIQSFERQILSLNQTNSHLVQNFNLIKNQNQGLLSDIEGLKQELVLANEHVQKSRDTQVYQTTFNKKSQEEYINQMNDVKHQLQCSKKMIAQLFQKIQQDSQVQLEGENTLSEKQKNHYIHLIDTQHNEIGALKGEVTRLTTQIKNISSQANTEVSFKTRATEREQQISKLNSINQELQIYIHTLESEKLEFKEKYDETLQNLVRAQDYIEQSQTRMKELQNELNIKSIDELSKDQQQLNAKNLQFFELEQDLTKATDKIRFLQNQIQRLNSLQPNRTLENDLKQLIANKEAQVVKLNTLLQDKEVQSSKLNSVITEIQKVNGLLRSKQTDITRLSSQLRDKEAQISRLNSLLGSKQFQLTRLRDALSNHNTQSNTKVLLQNSQAQARRLTNQLSVQQHQVSKLNNLLISKQGQISKANQLLLSRQLQIQRFNALLLSKQEELHNISSLASARQSQLHRLNILLTSREVQINGLKQSIANTKDQFSNYISQDQPPKEGDEQLLTQVKNLQHLLKEINNEKDALYTHLKQAEDYIFSFEQKNYEKVIHELNISIHNLQQERVALLSKQRDLQQKVHQSQQHQHPVTPSSLDSRKIQAYIQEIGILKQRIVLLEKQITNLEKINRQLQAKFNSLKIENQNVKKLNLAEIQKYKLLVEKLQKERQQILGEVETLKNNLVQEKPHSMKIISESRIRGDEFIEENRRIMDKLRNAEGYIQDLQFKCEEYLAEIQRLRNGDSAPSIAASRKTIKDILEEETPRKVFTDNLEHTSVTNEQLMKISQLQDTVIDLRGEAQSARNQLNSQIQIAKKFEGVYQQVENKNRQLQAKISQLQTEKAVLQGQTIKNLSDKIALLQQQKKTLQVSTIKGLQIKIQQLEREKHAFQGQRAKEHQLKIDQLSKDNYVLHQDNIHLTQILSENQFNIDKINAVSNEKRELQGVIGSLTLEKAILKSQIQRLHQVIQIQIKSAELSSAGNKQTERNHSIQKIKDLETKVEQLGKQKQLLNQDNIKLSQLNSTNEIKIQQIASFDNQKREFQRLIVKLQNEKVILGSENQRLNQTVKAKTDEIQVVQTKWQSIRHNLQILQTEKAKLAKQVQVVRTNSLQISHYPTQISNLKNTILRKDKELNEAVQNLKDAENFIAQNESLFLTAQKEKQQVQKKLIELQHNIINLNNINHLLQTQIDQHKRIQSATLTSSPADLQKLSELSSENNKQKVNNQRLVGQVQRLGRQASYLNAQIQKLKPFEAQYNKCKTDLELRNKDFQRLNDQLIAVQHQNAALSQQLKAVNSNVIEKLNKQSNENRTQLQKITNEKKFLEDSIFELNKLIERQRANFVELSQKLENEKQRLHEEVKKAREEENRQSQNKNKEIANRLAQLQPIHKGLESEHNIILGKLKQAQDFITYLEQERGKNAAHSNQSSSKPQADQNEMLHKLVEAESIILHLQTEREGIHKQQEKKIHEIEERDKRIQEQLQQTVIRVSEEHIHLTNELKRLQGEKRSLQNQLGSLNKAYQPQIKKLEDQVNGKNEALEVEIRKLKQENNVLQQKLTQREIAASQGLKTSTRVLDQMKATIGRLSQENKQLIKHHHENEQLRNQLKSASDSLSNSHTQFNQIAKQSQQQISQLRQKQNKLAETNTHLIHENDQLKSELLTASQKLLGSAQFNDQYSKMTESLNQIHLSLEQKSELINSLQASLKNQRSKTNKLDEDRTFFETKLFEAEQYISDTDKEKAELVKKMQDLRKQMQKMKLVRIQQRINEQAENYEVDNPSINSNSIMGISNIQQVKIQKEQPKQGQQQKSESENGSQNLNQFNSIIQQLQKEITQKENKIVLLESEIQRLNEIIQTMQSGNSPDPQLLKTIEHLQKQLISERQIKEHMKNALQASMENQDETEENVKKLEESVKYLKGVKDQLESQIKALKDRIQALQDQKKQLQVNGREAFTRQLEAHKKLNTDLIKTNHDNVKQINLLREKALQTTDLKHEIHQLQEELKEKEQIAAKLNEAEVHIRYLYEKEEQSMTLVENQKKNLNDQIANLTTQKQNLLSKIEQNIKLATEVQGLLDKQQNLKKNLETKVKQLEENIKKGSGELLTAHQEIQTLNAEIQNTQKHVIQPKQEELKRLNSEFKSLQKQKNRQLGSLSEDIEKINNQKLKLSEKLQRLVPQSENNLKTLRSLQISLNEKMLENKKLQEVVDASKETAKVKSLYEQQLKSSNQRIQGLLNEVSESQLQNNSLQNTLQQKLKELESALTKVGSLNVKNEELDLLHEHLMQEISQQHLKNEKYLSQISNLQNKLATQQSLAAQKQQRTKDLQSQLTSTANIIGQLENFVKQSQTQEQLLKSKLLQAEKYILALENRLSSTENKLKESVESKNELKSSQDLEISNLSSNLRDLSQQINNKAKQLLVSNNELLSIKEKLQVLQNKIQDQQKLLKEKNQQSLNNSHEITLLGDRLKENQEELLAQKVKNRDLENRNSDLNRNYNDLLKKAESLFKDNEEFNNRNNQLLDSLSTVNQQLQKLEVLYNALEAQKNQTDEEQRKSLQEIDNLGKLKVQLQSKLADKDNELQSTGKHEQVSKQYYEGQIKDLKDHLERAEIYISEMEPKVTQLNSHSKNLQNQRDLLDLKVKDLQNCMREITAKTHQAQVKKQQEESTVDTIRKLIDKLTKFVDQNDNLDIFKEENIERDLSANPMFKKLYETIKYKLKLLNAMDNQKSVTLSDKEKEIAELQKDINRLQSKLKEQASKINQAQIIQTSYQDVLGKMIEMERLNLALENEVSMLNNQLSIHKSQIQQFQNKIQNQSSSLSGEGDRADLSQNKDFLLDEKLKEENLKLRRLLEQAQYNLHRFNYPPNNIGGYNSPLSSPINKKSTEMDRVAFQVYLQQCLSVIQNLEKNVEGIQQDVTLAKERVEISLAKSNVKQMPRSKRSEDSEVLQKQLNQLERKLEESNKLLKQHKQSTEAQLLQLLRQAIITPLNIETQSPGREQFDRQKIEKYIDDLENMLLTKSKEHKQQVQKLKQIIDKKSKNQSSLTPYKEKLRQGTSEEDQRKNIEVQELLRQIDGLNDHMNIYHKEAQRRKENYRRTIEDLLKQIESLKKEFESTKPQGQRATQPVSLKLENLVLRTKSILQNQSSVDFDERSLNDDDYIMSNNYVQYIKSKKGLDEGQSGNQRQKQFVHDLHSIAEQFQNKESSNINYDQRKLSVENKILNFSNNNLSKDEILSKPILEFIVNNKEFDDEEVKLLKTKINEIQMRSNQEKYQFLKQNEKQLMQVLEIKKIQGERETIPQSVLNVLASNLTRQQVQNFIDGNASEQLLTKVQELITNSENSSSFLKQENNSVEMMQAIQEIKSKYYPDPTPLSEQMYHHLIKLLSSKDDHQFYSLVESLFQYLSMLQNDFMVTLRQKEQMYQKHTQKMNEVLGLNEQLSSDMEEDDEQYYKRVLLLGKQEEKQVQRIRKQQTQKGLSEQLQQELSNAKQN